MSPLVSPSQAVKPVVLEQFGVRVNGAWIIVAVSEAKAWAVFLDECRGAKEVELTRGPNVVARLVQGERILS